MAFDDLRKEIKNAEQKVLAVAGSKLSSAEKADIHKVFEEMISKLRRGVI